MYSKCWHMYILIINFISRIFELYNNNNIPWLSPSIRRGSHVKSDNTHTIIQRTPLSPYTWHLALIFNRCALFTVYPNRIMSHPSPGDNHQRTGERYERTQGQAKIAAWNSFSYICTRALHSFLSFADCRAASTVILCCPRPHSPHPSSLTSVYL